MSDFGLGWTRERLYDKYNREVIRPTQFGDDYKEPKNARPVSEKFFLWLLQTVGFTFPILWLVPTPMKKTFARQGFLTLNPSASYTWTFTAPGGSALILRTIHFQPLDSTSTTDLTFKWTHPQPGAAGSGPQNISSVDGEADATRTGVSGSVHVGLRKPLMLVLDYQQTADLILTNSSATRPAYVEFEIQGWYV